MLDETSRKRLLSLPSAVIADARCLLDLPESHLDPEIRPLTPFSCMVGSAVTVRLEVAPDKDTADLMRIHQAYLKPSVVSPIMTIQVPPELHSYGIFGGGAATLARREGFVGALIDGAVRDTVELRDMNFTVFSRTICPGFIVQKASVTSVGESVVVGGRTIRTGDVIVADNDGAIVVQPEELDAVMNRSEALQEWEACTVRAIAEGKSPEETDEICGPRP